MTLALWKAVVFMEGNYKRALAGSTDDPYLQSFGEGVIEIADRALAVSRAWRLRTGAAPARSTEHAHGPGRIRARARETWSVSNGQLIELSAASSALTTDCGSGEKSSEGPKVWPCVIA